jgi:propanol-preferring alcohol dehydrogenase
MCAGVTVYKGIKETEARAGQFITIIGAAGGLGHLACQYARAMGLRVIAVDVGAHKKAFCESLGAELAIDISASPSHAVLDLTAHPAAYRSAFALCRRKGTIVGIGIAGSDLHIPIADLVLRGITVRGSIVGTRQDMREALDFAERGDVCCSVETAPLSEVNEVVARLQRGEIEGRVVLEI